MPCAHATCSHALTARACGPRRSSHVHHAIAARACSNVPCAVSMRFHDLFAAHVRPNMPCAHATCSHALTARACGPRRSSHVHHAIAARACSNVPCAVSMRFHDLFAAHVRPSKPCAHATCFHALAARACGPACRAHTTCIVPLSLMRDPTSRHAVYLHTALVCEPACRVLLPRVGCPHRSCMRSSALDVCAARFHSLFTARACDPAAA